MESDENRIARFAVEAIFGELVIPIMTEPGEEYWRCYRAALAVVRPAVEALKSDALLMGAP